MKNIKVMKIKVKKRKEKKLIWDKTKHYIILWIIACCLTIWLNIHPNNKDSSLSSQEMIYVFHDYARNPYILNNSSHWSADEFNYLFNDTIPEDLKWEDYYSNTVSLKDLERNDIQNNQISIEDIMNELWIDNEYSWNILVINESNDNSWIDENTLIIDLSKDIAENPQTENSSIYNITEDWQTLTITKSKKIISLKNRWNFTTSDWKDEKLIIKDFQTITESWVLPSLIPRNQLENLDNAPTTSYSEEYDNSTNYTKNDETYKNIWGINIIPDYADCMTPWWYKISHWESVLAYKQMDNAPNICNIERRFCRNWKLSGTYSQQWCSMWWNNTYTKQNNNITTSSSSYSVNTSTQETPNINDTPTIKYNTKQNNDGSVTVYKPETEESFVFDRPSKASTDFHRRNDNIKISESVEQTEKEHINCITPRWEEVQHGQLVQAFKHANWFYDVPCETQIRLCSMWKLDGSYTQKSCRNWESSFNNRFNWKADKDKYYEEKLKKIKQRIEDEETYYNDIKWLSEEEALDKIFYRLDE